MIPPSPIWVPDKSISYNTNADFSLGSGQLVNNVSNPTSVI